MPFWWYNYLGCQEPGHRLAKSIDFAFLDGALVHVKQELLEHLLDIAHGQRVPAHALPDVLANVVWGKATVAGIAASSGL
jgi:hypothetical protein